MSQDIPKASILFKGDINEAVIAVQKMTGVSITPAWWGKHVGNFGTTQEILERFDAEYALEVMKRKTPDNAD